MSVGRAVVELVMNLRVSITGMCVDWDNKYLEKDTPWDLGDVTPAVADFVASKRYPYQPERVLVPGCGRVRQDFELKRRWAPLLQRISSYR